MRKYSWLVALLFVVGLVSTASAGVLSVRIPTQSGIEARFGMVQLWTMNWAKNYDFNSDTADFAWVGDPEGLVRDNYISHMVYFPIDFVSKDQWRAHVLFSYKGSDFDQGKDANYGTFQGVDYDRWRVERAYFEFKLPFFCNLNSWIGVGHDVWTLDRRGGGLVYFDDDPGIRWYGNYQKFNWDFKFARKAEQTDKVDFGTDSNRDLFMLKLGYDFGPAFKPNLFAAWDRNGAMTLHYPDDTTIGTWDVYYLGANAVGKVGAFIYQAELVYQGGSVDLNKAGEEHYGENNYDINAWAGLVNVGIDLAAYAPSLRKFVVSLGFLYASGDDDAKDDDLEGFTGITSATRFFGPWAMGTLPVHGANSQPVIGSVIYSWLPATYYGVGPCVGGVLGKGNDHGDNPGLQALVFALDWAPAPKWGFKFTAKYLQWDETDAIEAKYGESIDDEIGYEFNGMLTYKIYKNVTTFAGLSVFVPGDGIDDINDAKEKKGELNDDDADTAYHGQIGVKFVF